MRWTFIKHIVSERVCKWIRSLLAGKPVPFAGKFSLDKNKKRSGLTFVPGWLLLLVMGGLLLLAILRSLYQPSELLVAWGDDGSLPAVCYCSCPSPGWRKDTVLCPGGSNAATQLLCALNKRGCSRLESIFSSTITPAPRGARVLLKKKEVAEFILLVDTRRHPSSLKLVAEARSAGIAVREVHPVSGGESSHHQHWEFRSWRGKNGDLHWSFFQVKEQVQIILCWRKNGIFELQYQDRSAPKTIKQFPRSNRCGIWQVCLAHR